MGAQKGGGPEGVGAERPKPRKSGEGQRVGRPEGRGNAQEGWGPKEWRPKPGKSGRGQGWGGWRAGPRTPRRGGRGKISSFFFFLPPEISLFMLSLGVFSWNFGGVWSAGALQNGRLGSMGHRVKKFWKKIKKILKIWKILFEQEKQKHIGEKKKKFQNSKKKSLLLFYFLFLFFLFCLFLKIIFVFL